MFISGSMKLVLSFEFLVLSYLDRITGLKIDHVILSKKLVLLLFFCL